MVLRIGVVNRFRGQAPRYQIGLALESLGARYVPLELGTLSVVHHHGATSVLVDSGDGPVPLEHLALDAVLWRITENDSAACAPLLAALAAEHLLVNPLECIELCSSKWATAVALEAAGIPVVATTFVPPTGVVPDLGDPVVVKPDGGAGGRGVHLVRPGDPATTAVLAQPWAGGPEQHRRVLVCGGRAVLSVVRRPAPGAFVNNVDAGGDAEVVPVGSEAVTAQEVFRLVGAVVAGVDLVDDDGLWRVLEVNSNPGINSVMDAGAPQAVADAVLRAVRARC